MIWDGETIYTLWGYRPNTIPSITWDKVGNGNWRGDDRGSGEDVYEARIIIKAPADEMATLESVLGSIDEATEGNRENFSITCGAGEEIFGADIDYSGSLDVVVISYGKIMRESFAQYSMALDLRLLSPTFTGSASLSTLGINDFRYEAGSDWDLIKKFTYNGTPSYIDMATDPGICTVTFRQTTAQMKAIRRYLLTTARSSTVAFPSSIGIDTPFGQRMGSGSFNCKIIGWRDMGRKNYIDWEIEITFVREF